jgi:hypothetical protein
VGKARAAWDRFVDLAGLHIERIGIPTRARRCLAADSHCEPAANGIRGERIFNWLDQAIRA